MASAVPTSLRLPADVDARLERLAAETNRSKSFYLRELVTTGLDRLEWEYSIAKRAEDIRAGRRETVPLEDVERELGIQDEPVDMSILDEVE
ncbi:type II toxin-antitoxin system RelB family antitoxin [Nesterenkonia haasae]|uniref:type II toxin-antitoxin system RelB family antitoxin n=1 Tax=Nesterenkonia haasae TaxID=2587813 RepID=UPI001391FA58|nr:ribbon-helix-helix domain-containing protein [Nesterenkonia haasae]NDK31671.1 ribbon-helix-helix protein, CopG family [Nesterenkonia haasae]